MDTRKNYNPLKGVFIVLIFLGLWQVYEKINQKAPVQQNVPIMTNKNKPADTSTPTAQTTAQTGQVTIKDFAFGPSSLTVKKGDTVTWTNQDSAPHQIAGTNFKSEMLSNGGTYSFTFNEAGTFDYHCSIHPLMKGTVVVQ
jgi:amicyanin